MPKRMNGMQSTIDDSAKLKMTNAKVDVESAIATAGSATSRGKVLFQESTLLNRQATSKAKAWLIHKVDLTVTRQAATAGSVPNLIAECQLKDADEAVQQSVYNQVSDAGVKAVFTFVDGGGNTQNEGSLQSVANRLVMPVQFEPALLVFSPLELYVIVTLATTLNVPFGDLITVRASLWYTEHYLEADLVNRLRAQKGSR